MKIAFKTLGCKVNQYETEVLKELFVKNGWEIGAFEEICDAYVINTCSVTSMSDRKSRQMIHQAVRANPEAIIAVCGCYSEVSGEEVSGIEGVDIVAGTKNKNEIFNEISKRTNRAPAAGDFSEITCFEGKTRAIIKIEDGCDNFCSYCIIPYARGRVKSRDEEEIIRESRKISAAGYKEIVLAGIHVCSYGKDTGSSLINLLERLEKETDIERIRLSSIEPNAFFDGFIPRLASLSKLCPHFHISLQSGCDETLKRMNRRYTSADYEKICRELLSFFPDCAITTDVIVGFPGETDEEFLKTVSFLNKLPLRKIHTFKFSERKGTAAAKMSGKISPGVKDERSKVVIGISAEKEKAFKKASVGKTAGVLVEKYENGFCKGYSENYLPVRFKSDKDLSNQTVKMILSAENLG